jgi:hypothetical protein
MGKNRKNLSVEYAFHNVTLAESIRRGGTYDMDSSLLVALSSPILERTTDFTPLFFGLLGGLYYCAVAAAFAVWVYDTYRSQSQSKPAAEQPATDPEFLNAA